MAGLFFEEFSEGQVFEHAITRTVTEMDNVLFTTMTMNVQPLHLGVSNRCDYRSLPLGCASLYFLSND